MGDERLAPVEERTEQRRKLDRSFARLGHRHAKAHPPPLGVANGLEEEPRLADAARSLDHDHATGAGGDLIEARANQPELRLAPLNTSLRRPERPRSSRAGVARFVLWSLHGPHLIR